MDCDQALEDNGPCRVAQPVLQSPKYLSYPGLARMRRDEDVLNVLGLWGRGLQATVSGQQLILGTSVDWALEFDGPSLWSRP